MRKIIATVGISASGKTSWAHEQWKKDPQNIVIIERDTIRNLLFGYDDVTIYHYYERKDVNKLEKQVTSYQNTLIYDALEQDKTVILSNTHLNRKRDLEALKYWNVSVELKMFPVDYLEAVRRDIGRIRSVGFEVIKKQYNRFVNLEKDLKISPIDFTPIITNVVDSCAKCYVFDIDGCIAEKGERNPFDWGRVGEDTPIQSVIDVMDKLIEEYEIYVCSGRDEACREQTWGWLARHTDFCRYASFENLQMRKKGDNRPDWIVKQEMVKKINGRYHTKILGWFDDRLQVTRHLRMLGIKTFNVEHNNF